MSDRKYKKCRKCERRLGLKNFNKDSKSADGLRTMCRDCQREHGMKYRKSKQVQAVQTTNHEEIARRMRAEANRNALLSLMKRHIAEFDAIYDMEIRRIKAAMGDPEAQKVWIGL